MSGGGWIGRSIWGVDLDAAAFADLAAGAGFFVAFAGRHDGLEIENAKVERMREDAGEIGAEVANEV